MCAKLLVVTHFASATLTDFLDEVHSSAISASIVESQEANYSSLFLLSGVAELEFESLFEFSSLGKLLGVVRATFAIQHPKLCGKNGKDNSKYTE